MHCRVYESTRPGFKRRRLIAPPGVVRTSNVKSYWNHGDELPGTRAGRRGSDRPPALYQWVPRGVHRLRPTTSGPDHPPSGPGTLAEIGFAPLLARFSFSQKAYPNCVSHFAPWQPKLRPKFRSALQCIHSTIGLFLRKNEFKNRPKRSPNNSSGLRHANPLVQTT